MKNLPKGWTSAALSELVRPRQCRVSPSAYPNSKYIGLEHVEAHTMKLLGSVSSDTMKSSAAKFEATDVLYGRLRPYLNKVIRPEFDGLCSAEFIVLPNTKILKSAFLQYRLHASDFLSYASHLDEGDRPRVDYHQIGQFIIDVPPQQEQQRIVAKIEELFSDLDAGVASLQRVKQNLKRYRAALLNSAVTGKLTNAWRNQNPPSVQADELLSDILKERRRNWETEQSEKYAAAGRTPPKDWKNRYDEPQGATATISDPLPNGWTQATFDQVTQEVTVGFVGPMKDRYVDDGISFLRSQNVRPLRFDPLGLQHIPAEFDEDLKKSRSSAVNCSSFGLA